MLEFVLLSSADHSIVQNLVVLINTAFAYSEGGMWKDEYERTCEEELRKLIQDKQLFVAKLNSKIIGACKITISNNIGDLGMLAFGQEERGKGYGTEFLHFYENYCKKIGCQAVNLEVLYPKNQFHLVKDRTIKWYKRNGYKEERDEDFGANLPHLAHHLAVPCRYTVFQKIL